ncbi:MAG: AMP-binding protein [Planctomycetes bacterium]|nr:AMP-binding protein [Planctomycetota bacterium]
MSSAAAPRFANVSAWLAVRAAAQPDAPAVVVARRGGDVVLTCAELDRLCDRTAHALQRAGIGAGMRTALMVPPSPDFFALTFALFKLGAVPVLIDPGLGVRNLGRCLATAEPQAFVGIGKAQLARALLGWGRSTLRIRIRVGAGLPLGSSLAQLRAAAPDIAFPVAATDPEQPAAILFTSGSTGPPKGVLYRHRTFTAQVEALQALYGIEPGEVDLATFPLFALFGPALGMASVVPRMNASRPAAADPRALVESIRAWSCTSMFASPALIELLGRHCETTGTRLPTLRRVVSAGAPASPAALERLCRQLNAGVEVHTPYGATEALPVSSIGSAEILAETRARTDAGGGVCVGHPAPGIEVAILRIDDGPIPEWSDDLCLPQGEVGEIAVRGAVVTDAYYGLPEATARAKIRDGARLWHRMGDVGYVDEGGRLWMCGRKAHRVETAAGTLHSVPCEAVFDVHPAVRRSALVGVRGVPVLCVELLAGRRGSDELVEELRALGQRFEHTRGIGVFLFHPGFPVDVRHNAKIDREKLAAWAAGRVRT